MTDHEMTDYEILYAKVKDLWDNYVATAEMYEQIGLRVDGALALKYKAKRDAFYQATIMLREMLDE